MDLIINWNGIILGVVAFTIIGLFHPLVIKAEYYFGKNASCTGFFIAGLISTICSLLVQNTILSASLGVLGFSCFWSIKEVIEQVQRVKEGRYPKNPKRNYDK